MTVDNLQAKQIELSCIFKY